MIVEDFILRIIRQAVQLIAKALGLSEEGYFLESEAVLNDGLFDLTGLSMDSLLRMSVESIGMLFDDNPGKIIVSALFLKGYGDTRKEKGDFEGYVRSLDKSLELFLRVQPLGLEEVDQEIGRVKEELASLEA
ncbi:MAG: hypothetical protein R6W96_08485 [Clostridia bacterium]